MVHDTAASRLGSRLARNVPSRLPSLTGARFVAAAFVFCFHSTYVYPFASAGAQKTTSALFTQGGYAGVTFFFVLSGFVLTWSMRQTDTAPKFWRRRFFKIYPNHLLTFLAALILLTVVTRTTVRVSDGVLNLLLLQSWSTNLSVRFDFNPVAWSLSCEALFYFCFPFLLKLINKIRAERLWFWTVLSAVAVISIPSFALLLPKGQVLTGFTTWQLWFGFDFPPVAMLEFIFGIFLAKLMLTGRRLPLKLGGAVALTVAGYAITALVPPTYEFVAVMVVPLGLLISAAAAADVDRTRTFIGSRLMVKLGDISFAFYVWHYLVLAYGHHWLGSGQNWSTVKSAGVMILLFAISVVLAWATFTFFEQPIMNRFATSRRKRDLAAVTTGPTDDTPVEKVA